MVTDLLASGSSGGLPLIGGGVIGFGAGYILKKIAKILIIAVGGIALLLGFLEYQKWIAVNWTVVQNQTSTIMTRAAHKAYVVTHQMGHETTGIGLGVMGYLVVMNEKVMKLKFHLLYLLRIQFFVVVGYISNIC